ncbi:hypothetical protein QOZ80_4AG0301380 [Eleusine coracana subsp. coracana]|nr:hypothetical protein QOZ80_4AG0301380 [Eleusine coracana subsp. coracana]
MIAASETMSLASSTTAAAADDDEAAAVPWPDLLPELCGLVADRLDGFSVLSFPAVCKSWAAAYTEEPGVRSGFPTMLTSGLDRTSNAYTVYDYEEGVFALHDVSTAKSFSAAADGLMCRCWVGGKDDWLVTTDADCQIELLNPVNGALSSSPLPSFDTIHGVKVDGEFGVWVEPEVYPQKIQRAGRALPDAGAPGRIPGRANVLSKPASLHAIWGTSEGRQIRRKIYDGQPQGTFLASDVGLYQLDETSNGTWRRVSDIGNDCALFLGANYPFYITVPFGSGGSKHLKPNCIYVADMASSDAAVIDLETGVEDNFRCLDYLGESDAFQMPIRFRPTAYLDLEG